MTLLERLIAALHTAGGETIRSADEWLELAQSHHGLLEALRGVFGKRLPTVQKFGLWASEHLGAESGELVLQGKHSPRRKAWIYRVASKARLEELARQAAEARAAREARHVEIVEQGLGIDARRLARELKHAERDQAPPLTIAVQPPAPAPEYEQTVRPGPDGQPVTETLRGRDGKPVSAQPSAPEKPARAPEPPEPARPDPNAEPPETAGLTPPDGQWWSGCGRPRTALERHRLRGKVITWKAGTHWQSNMPAPGLIREEHGFMDPGGSVSQNMWNQRNAGRTPVTVLPCLNGPWRMDE